MELLRKEQGNILKFHIFVVRFLSKAIQKLVPSTKDVTSKFWKTPDFQSLNGIMYELVCQIQRPQELKYLLTSAIFH